MSEYSCQVPLFSLYCACFWPVKQRAHYVKGSSDYNILTFRYDFPLFIYTVEASRDNYIEHWLTVLKDDKRLLVTAAGQADKAVRLILNDKEDGDDVHEG